MNYGYTFIFILGIVDIYFIKIKFLFNAKKVKKQSLNLSREKVKKIIDKPKWLRMNCSLLSN